MTPLPSRWYRTIYDSSDIKDFERHRRQLATFPITEREYPGSVQVRGDAYHLVRVVYKTMERGLLFSTLGALFGNPFNSVATALGRIALECWTRNGRTVEDSIKYIHSSYLIFGDDDGSSAKIFYADVFAIDNVHWEPKDFY